MRKFRASMEHFWDLKIGKCVEWLTCVHVSSEYFISGVLPSLISTAGQLQTSCVFLGYIIPWINKVSLALYIARISQRATINRSEVRKLYSAVKFVPVIDWSIETCHYQVESRSQTPCLRQHAALCTHYIDDLLPHAPLPLCSYWGHGQEFHHNYRAQLGNLQCTCIQRIQPFILFIGGVAQNIPLHWFGDNILYSRKFSRGSIFIDMWSLPFCGLNFYGHVWSCQLYTVQLHLFHGFNFHG
jgi:hypothetical protein